MRSQYLEFYHEYGAKGVPILAPFNGCSWEERLVFPAESGEIWRFG